eukprot:gene35829-8527_t
MLSATPLTQLGPASMVFYDIHALQERFYFRDQVRPVLQTAIPLVRREIDRLKVAVAFPDDGAKKRFGPLFHGPDGELFPNIVCSKVREGTKRTLKITEGKEDVANHHVVIIDDLDLLIAEGATAVSGYVTHGRNDRLERVYSLC